MPVTCPECGANFKGNKIGSHVWRCNVSPLQVFMLKVDKNGPGGCWLWTGYRQKFGHGWMGYVNEAGKHIGVLAHRRAWELMRGPVPEGECVLHTCDVPACVNPEHLWLGSWDDNMADMRAKKRHTIGERNPKARISDATASAILAEYTGAWGEQTALALKYGLDSGLVHALVSGKLWKHLPRPRPFTGAKR